MKDELYDLLHRADAYTPAPEYDASNLATRIRRKAKNQRRVATGSFSVLALSLALIPSLLSRSSNETQIVKTNTDLDPSIHEQTASILLANRRTRSSVHATDTFLADLQMQRNRAALLLLRDANRQSDSSDPIRVATLKKTIELFPETPAAAIAIQWLEQVQPLKRQS